MQLSTISMSCTILFCFILSKRYFINEIFILNYKRDDYTRAQCFINIMINNLQSLEYQVTFGRTKREGGGGH